MDNFDGVYGPVDNSPTGDSSAPKQLTKNQAYTKCLLKSKECSENIPAIQLEFQKVCKDIYMVTPDEKELVEFTQGMC